MDRRLDSLARPSRQLVESRVGYPGTCSVSRSEARNREAAYSVLEYRANRASFKYSPCNFRASRRHARLDSDARWERCTTLPELLECMSGQKRPHSAAYDSPAPSSRSRPSAATPPPSKRPRPDPSTRTDTGTASQHAGRVAGDSYGWASPLTGALESLRQLRQWVASTAAAAAAPDPIPPRPKSLVDGLAGTRTGPQSSRTLREIKRKAAEIDSEKRAYYRARLDAKRNNQPMPEKPERLKDLQATLSGLRLDERAASEALDARDTAEGRRNGPALNGSAYHRRRPMGMSKVRSRTITATQMPSHAGLDSS